MSDKMIARVQRDLKDLAKCQETEACPISIELKDDNFKTLTGVITGPPDTVYEGGKFILDITIPDKYPMAPPKIKFVTKVWHPNVCSKEGGICLDILDNRWAAVMTLRTVLLSIQVLFSSISAKDALDLKVAKQFKKAKELFDRTARHWTNVYAGGPNREEELEEKVKELMDKSKFMDEFKARRALSANDWDVEKVLEKIVKHSEKAND